MSGTYSQSPRCLDPELPRNTPNGIRIQEIELIFNR